MPMEVCLQCYFSIKNLIERWLQVQKFQAWPEFLMACENLTPKFEQVKQNKQTRRQIYDISRLALAKTFRFWHKWCLPVTERLFV